MKVQGFADRDDLRLQCWRGFQKTCSPLGCRQVIVFFFPLPQFPKLLLMHCKEEKQKEKQKKNPNHFQAIPGSVFW